MSNKMSEYLTGVINDCFDAVQASKIGPLRCDDPSHMAVPAGQPAPIVCAHNFCVHGHAFQTFLTLVQSVAPKYHYNEMQIREPREPWQGGEEDNPNGAIPTN